MPLLLDINSIKRKVFKNLVIKVKNLIIQGKAKEENSRDKLNKKPLN